MAHGFKPMLHVGKGEEPEHESALLGPQRILVVLRRREVPDLARIVDVGQYQIVVACGKERDANPCGVR